MRFKFWLHLPVIMLILGVLGDVLSTSLVYITYSIFPEINPLYKLLGNFWLFIVIYVIIFVGIIKTYYSVMKLDIYRSYLFYLLFTLGGIIRLIVSWNNFQYVLHPITDPAVLNATMQVVNSQGTLMYWKGVGLFMVLPVVVIMLIFYGFTKTKKLTMKE